MTTLNDLIYDYLFEEDEDGVKLYEKWLDEYPYYDRQVELMKQNGEDDDYEDEAREIYEEEFVAELFINWDKNYNFYLRTDIENRANEVDAMMFLRDLKRCIKWFDDEFATTIDITEMTEEKIWNEMAYWFVAKEGCSNLIKKNFVEDFTKRVRDKMEEQLELENVREYRHSCDICYEKKQIDGICASCGTKYFCKGCWSKTAGKKENCPFCRCLMALPIRVFCNFDRVNNNHYKINEDREKWRQNIRSIISVIPQYVRCLEEKWRTDKIIQNIKKKNEDNLS
jgi:hypothetical protein